MVCMWALSRRYVEYLLCVCCLDISSWHTSWFVSILSVWQLFILRLRCSYHVHHHLISALLIGSDPAARGPVVSEEAERHPLRPEAREHSIERREDRQYRDMRLWQQLQGMLQNSQQYTWLIANHALLVLFTGWRDTIYVHSEQVLSRSGSAAGYWLRWVSGIGAMLSVKLYFVYATHLVPCVYVFILFNFVLPTMPQVRKSTCGVWHASLLSYA